MLTVLLIVVFPQGTGLGPPHDMIPHLIQPSPPVRQARAYRAPEGAVNVADNVQSGALGYWNKIAPPVIVVRVRLRLDVGVGVEHLIMNGYHEGQHPGRGNSEEAELRQRHVNSIGIGMWRKIETTCGSLTKRHVGEPIKDM